MFTLQSTAKSLTVLAPVFIAVMVVWLMVSCTIYFSSIRAVGTVVQLIEKGSGDNVYYCPVFVFRDIAGIEHTNHASGGSNPPRHPVGAKISVLYREKNPDTGQIDDPIIFWVVPVILFFFSALCGFVGYWILRSMSKQHKPMNV